MSYASIQNENNYRFTIQERNAEEAELVRVHEYRIDKEVKIFEVRLRIWKSVNDVLSFSIIFFGVWNALWNAHIHAAYRHKARRDTKAITNTLSLMPA